MSRMIFIADFDWEIRVVIVKRSLELFSDCPSEWVAFFCTDADVLAESIVESVADRSAIEQNFHNVEEVHGAGEQQVRNVWCKVACWNLCLWLLRPWSCGRGVDREHHCGSAMTHRGMIRYANQVTRSALKH